MAWLRVHDGFYDHRKIDETPLSAIGLWVRCGSFTAKQGDDGHLSTRTVRRMDARPRDIDALVRVGLWLPTPDGFVMHDFLEWNLSAAQVAAAKKRAAARQNAYRERRE